MNTTCPPPATGTTAPAANAAARTTAPSVGVTENLQKPLYTVTGNPDAYEVRVEMPGVPKSAVHIDLEKNILSIRGDRPGSTPEGWKALHRELSPLGYQLRLRLNTPVDEEKLAATLENGVLTLTLPVKEAAKPRRVEIQ